MSGRSHSRSQPGDERNPLLLAAPRAGISMTTASQVRPVPLPRQCRAARVPGSPHAAALTPLLRLRPAPCRRHSARRLGPQPLLLQAARAVSGRPEGGRALHAVLQARTPCAPASAGAMRLPPRLCSDPHPSVKRALPRLQEAAEQPAGGRRARRMGKRHGVCLAQATVSAQRLRCCECRLRSCCLQAGSWQAAAAR